MIARIPHEGDKSIITLDAAAIVSKENSSRETLLENLGQAFHNAGLPIAAGTAKEAQ
ncbi:MAG TPA: hypothetical protein VJS43_18625 [Candidatus Acidoferrales bacterium]|nr:hypothetical protein [Candidatus Acidoferrales bacterium]